MKFFHLLSFAILSTFFVACSSSSLLIKNADTESSCQSKDGYWYKDKCWKDFKEEGVTNQEIDKKVEAEMQLINATKVNINGKKVPLKMFFPDMGKKQTTFITMFEQEAQTYTILMLVPNKKLKKKKFEQEAIFLEGNVMEMDSELEDIEALLKGAGLMQVTIRDLDKLDLSFSGTLTHKEKKDSYKISYDVNEAVLGAGTSKLVVKGTEAYLDGDLGTITYNQMKDVIDNHPEVKTIVLGQISGSLNDEVNMHTGRILHEAGLTTKVLKDSEIASGGVDLFCAGTTRIVEKGAKIGIHSWCCVNDLTAIELPKDHPAHQYQLAYFKMCLGENLGPKFYFRTLEAAPFDSVHWMTDENIVKWKVATDFVK